jgi:hypothetical protein
MSMALMPAGRKRPGSALPGSACPGAPGGAPGSGPSLARAGDARAVNRTSACLIKANHSKGWDAKPLAYVLGGQDRVAGLPGEHSTS